MDLLFEIVKNGKTTLAIIEAKAAGTLSALAKDTKQMRQAGHDYNANRLANFIDTFKADPARAADVAAARQAMAASEAKTLQSYAYLARGDKFFKVDFNGPVSVPKMKATPISWSPRPAPYI